MASKVDWYYHRPNCMTCGRSQDFLNKRKIAVKETVNAAKIRFEPAAALEMARQASRVIVAREKVVTFDMKRTPPDDETLLKHLIGPSGKLRAPVIRRGATMLVGFDESEFARVLDPA